MFNLICAEKDSYDSNIKITKIGGTLKNREVAEEVLLKFLTEDIMMVLSDRDYEKMKLSFENPYDDLKPILKEAFANNEKRFVYGDSDYVELLYNKRKDMMGYVFPVSSINEYRGRTVSLVMC